MKKLFIIIIIIYFYSSYSIQIQLSIQNIYATASISKNIFKRAAIDFRFFSSKYEPIVIQPSIGNRNDNVQHISPDRYIPPPSSQFIKSTPNNQLQNKSQNISKINISRTPFISHYFNITPDRYIPPPSMIEQEHTESSFIQQTSKTKNITIFNPIIQNISSSLYNQINIDIENGKTFFSSLYNFCTLPLVHFACNVDINSLPPKYNFDNIIEISNNAKHNLEDYKNNPSTLTEQRFKQANLNLTNCLDIISINTQNQLHSLLGAQGESAIQNIADTLKINDIVRSIVQDFVKLGSINEQLDIRPDPLINKCI